MKRRLATLMFVSGLTFASTGQATAPEQKSPKVDLARERFNRGVGLFRDGDFRAALIEFNRAYETLPNYRVLYNIGQTCLELSDYACALRGLEQYLFDGGSEVPEDRRLATADDIKRLKTLVGYVQVTVDPPGAEVLVDNVSVGHAPISQPILVGAGRRTISALSPPLEPVVRAVDVAGGDRLDVKIVMNAAKAAPEASPAQRTAEGHDRPRSRAPLWIGIASTAALAGATTVVGILTLSAKRDLDRLVTTFPVTSSEVDHARSKVKGLAMGTDVLGAATVLAAGITTYIVLSSSVSRGPSEPRLKLGVTPGGATLQGRF